MATQAERDAAAKAEAEAKAKAEAEAAEKEAQAKAQALASGSSDQEGGDPTSPTQDGDSGSARPVRVAVPGLITGDHLGSAR